MSEIAPGIYEYESLKGFKRDQAWQYSAHYNKSHFGGYDLFEVRYDEPYSRDVQDLYANLIMNHGADEDIGFKITNEHMSRLNKHFTSDSVALEALSVLSERQNAKLSSWREARNTRMADTIVKNRESLHLLAAYTEPTRDNSQIQGFFGKLWGIAIDQNAAAKPVVLGKNDKLAIVRPEWPSVSLYYGKVS